jgi:hypothetical protein
MADHDSAVALKIKTPKNAMDESDRANAASGAFPQTQGAFQPQQGAFGRFLDELSGSKPAY